MDPRVCERAGAGRARARSRSWESLRQLTAPRARWRVVAPAALRERRARARAILRAACDLRTRAHPGAASPAARRHADAHGAAREVARAVSAGGVAMTVAPALCAALRGPSVRRDRAPARPARLRSFRAAAPCRASILRSCPRTTAGRGSRALGIPWIVGIAGDRPDHKNWPSTG